MQAPSSFRGRPGHQNHSAAEPARLLQSQEKKSSHRVLLALDANGDVSHNGRLLSVQLRYYTGELHSLLTAP